MRVRVRTEYTLGQSSGGTRPRSSPWPQVRSANCAPPAAPQGGASPAGGLHSASRLGQQRLRHQAPQIRGDLLKDLIFPFLSLCCSLRARLGHSPLRWPRAVAAEPSGSRTKPSANPSSPCTCALAGFAFGVGATFSKAELRCPTSCLCIASGTCNYLIATAGLVAEACNALTGRPQASEERRQVLQAFFCPPAAGRVWLPGGHATVCATPARSPRSASAWPVCARRRTPHPRWDPWPHPPRCFPCPSRLAALWPWPARPCATLGARVSWVRTQGQALPPTLPQHATTLAPRHLHVCSPCCGQSAWRFCDLRQLPRWRSAQRRRGALQCWGGCVPKGQGRQAGLARCQAPGALAMPATSAWPPGPPRCNGTPTNWHTGQMILGNSNSVKDSQKTAPVQREARSCTAC